MRLIYKQIMLFFFFAALIITGGLFLNDNKKEEKTKGKTKVVDFLNIDAKIGFYSSNEVYQFYDFDIVFSSKVTSTITNVYGCFIFAKDTGKWLNVKWINSGKIPPKGQCNMSGRLRYDRVVLNVLELQGYEFKFRTRQIEFADGTKLNFQFNGYNGH